MTKPKVIFLLCSDEVIIDKSNKLSIIGIFNIINSQKFPAAHPKFSIVTRWSGGEGVFKIRTRLLDSEKKEVSVSPEHELNFQSVDRNHDEIVTLVGFVFEKAGTYTIEAILNDETIFTQQLILNQLQS
ncbi:MAG TPA: hypothetical protein PLR20_14540 [Syntrophales bacterium]|jgi:hypothetical protein|nr:hypothetical protein [Syntrophales bacterium]HPN25792.1 hypothetical protein [Syntrophales bacterium]HQM30563.1 hypothetical protein [Syntrophales bacterium]